MANASIAPAVVIDFAAAKARRSAQHVQRLGVRPQRTREELLRVGRDAWIQEQLLLKIAEWGWDE